MEWLNFIKGLEAWYCSILMTLFMISFRWVFKKKIIKLIKKRAEETENKYDDFVVSILELPVCVALYFSVFYVAIVNAPIFAVRYLGWAIKLLRLVLLFSFFWGVYRVFLPIDPKTGELGIVHRFVNDVVEDKEKIPKNQRACGNLLSIGARILVCVVAVGVFSNELGYDLSAFIASLSIGTAAILYASKDAFSNVVSSIIILLDKPFVEKDWIKAGSIEGIVQEISFRSTKIKNLSNEEVYIPSSLLVNTPIINISRCKKRRIRIELAVSMDTERELLEKVILEIRQYLKSNDALAHKEKDIRVNFIDFHYICYKIEVICFMHGFDQIEFLRRSNEINLAIVDILEANHVKLAFQGKDNECIKSIGLLSDLEKNNSVE